MARRNSPQPTEASKPTLPEQPAEEGLNCSTQTLYEGPPKCQCCTNWVEEYPDDLRIAVEEQPDVKQKAIVIRMGKSHKDGKVLALHSIVVQSASLKQTLGEVFEGFEGITNSLKKLVFKAPFHPFYYRWSTFREILERQRISDPDAAKYTQLLYDILEKDLRDVMAEVEDLLQNRVMTYSLLWALFVPGKLVVTTDDRDERFFITHRSEFDFKCKRLVVHAKFVDWNGERFGYSDDTLCIDEYSGTRPITDLEVYPVDFHESREASEIEAIKRGQKFRDLQGFHYMAYSGLVRARSGRGEMMQRNCDGRIVIDSRAYYHALPSSRQNLASLTSKSIAPRISVVDDRHQVPAAPSFSTDAPLSKLLKPYVSFQKLTMILSDKDLNDEHLLICNTRVRGYSLKIKTWVEFRVNNITDIVYNEAAFDHLILPQGYKQLILSFIEGSKRAGFDDIIGGKGLGIIMLLVGNPGTGKTLTAEALADKLRKPLYILSAGELGQDAECLEPRLTEIFELTAKWDAVLLFNECDVFLQERSTAHLAHNEIVAVFLRLLEYYRGILLMTTNRVNTIDPAFKSRIHLTLHYPDLTPEARQQLWRRFIDLAVPKNAVSGNDVERLAVLPINGREVKNVIKVATLLSYQEEKDLGLEQITTVLRATGVIGVNSDI
ncbi:hypothetical protein CCUS01_15214 [Colletotrichum cuscutae]|uniref:AAA+ ATPase domain-containing protein n=1 Tax=Colletotrichum cuscutae TaxID=1209917 RepID=A0AAI9Y7E2_9PEZI|nr:hypothetical protein CCUS01_15214 [Colletotrichum cuscutae]